jgi:HK97 family phage prohead protease
MKTEIKQETLATFGDRLVTLGDGQVGLRAGLQMEIREPALESDAEAPQLEFIASDETLDRYHEILVAGGWKLEQYRRNPVFQNAHQYGDVIFTLGKAVTTEVRGDKLFQRVEFATRVNPLAKIAYGLYRGKFLNAVSVGFIPLRWENGSADTHFRRKYLEQELLEVSAVGIPANPNALQMGLRAGAIEKADLQELAELLRMLTEPLRAAHDLRAAAQTTAPGEAARTSDAERPGSLRIPIRWPESDRCAICGHAVTPSSAAASPTGGTAGIDPLLRFAGILRQILRRA